MNEQICGHDRKAIKSALHSRVHGPLSHDTDSPILLASGGLAIVAACDAMRAAFDVVDDSAKLVEIIVQTVQELGVACELWRNVRDFYDAPSDNALDVIVGNPILYFYAGSMKRMTMSQVHVFALRLLQWEGEFDLAKVLEGL